MKKSLFLPFTAFLLVCYSEGLAAEEVSDIAAGCVFDTMLTVANYGGPTNVGTDDAQEQAGKFVRGLGNTKRYYTLNNV